MALILTLQVKIIRKGYYSQLFAKNYITDKVEKHLQRFKLLEFTEAETDTQSSL